MEWSNIYLIIFYPSKSLHIPVVKNLFIEHVSSFGKWRLADVQGCFVIWSNEGVEFHPSYISP